MSENETSSPGGKPVLSYDSGAPRSPLRWGQMLLIAVAISLSIYALAGWLGGSYKLTGHRVTSQSDCASNLRKIGLALRQYNLEQKGAWPTDLGQLQVMQDLWPDVLACPEANWPPTSTPEQYVYIRPISTLSESTVIAIEPLRNHGGRANVLFADGRVESFKTKALKAIVERLCSTGELTQQQADGLLAP